MAFRLGEILVSFGVGSPGDFPSSEPAVGGATYGDVTLRTGVTLNYVERGHGDTVILFLHGYLDSLFGFSEILPLLPPRYHAYALTHRGHGDSEKPAAGYEIAVFAEDAVAFMEHFGIRRAVVVGHSMGSVISQYLAFNHPDRVSRLVLIDSATHIKGSWVLFWLQVVPMPFGDPLPFHLAYPIKRTLVYSRRPDEFMRRIGSEAVKAPRRVWRDALKSLRMQDTRQDIRRIKAPTLLFWGDKDNTFSRKDQQELLTGIPDARLVVFDKAAHGAHWDFPERVTHDLLAFLDDHPER